MHLRPKPADPAELRQAHSSFPSGVNALCGCIDGRPTAMAASPFTCVSLEPPVVSVEVQKNSKTWLQLRRLPRLGISVMAEDQGPVCRTLAGPGDRFQGIAAAAPMSPRKSAGKSAGASYLADSPLTMDV